LTLFENDVSHSDLQQHNIAKINKTSAVKTKNEQQMPLQIKTLNEIISFGRNALRNSDTSRW